MKQLVIYVNKKGQYTPWYKKDLPIWLHITNGLLSVTRDFMFPGVAEIMVAHGWEWLVRDVLADRKPEHDFNGE